MAPRLQTYVETYVVHVNKGSLGWEIKTEGQHFLRETSVCICVRALPCLQGEVEADALAAGLARLSGPNLQRRKRGKGTSK